MSDEPREPIEPELITNPPPSSPPVGPAGFSVHIDPVDGQRYVRLGLPPAPRPARPVRKRLALVLFLLTVASTFYVGTEKFGYGDPILNAETRQFQRQYTWKSLFVGGALYSTCVLAILGAHEMGHYLLAKFHRVPASPPFFIPMPVGPFGTMGAVIVQQAGVADRRSMFDIAIAGPLAGLVLAIPIAAWGISKAEITPDGPPLLPPGTSVRFEVYHEPLLLKWMERLILGIEPSDQSIRLNPYLFAGWVGLFITGLNLIPIGQLDGGHLLYCLLGRRAHTIARALFLGAVAIVAVTTIRGNGAYTSWAPMLILLWMMGTRHPPTADDGAPLGGVRIIIGWLTLAFIIVSFTPSPIDIREYHAPPPRIRFKVQPHPDFVMHRSGIHPPSV